MYAGTISTWVTWYFTSTKNKKRDAHSTPTHSTSISSTTKHTPDDTTANTPPPYRIHTGSKLRSLPTPPSTTPSAVSRDPRRDPLALIGPSAAAAGCPASPEKEGSSFSWKAAEEPPSPRRARRSPAGFHQQQQKRRRRLWGALRDGFGSATTPMKNWHRTVRVAIA